MKYLIYSIVNLNSFEIIKKLFNYLLIEIISNDLYLNVLTTNI